MIEYLKGNVLKKIPTGIVVDVQGVGYRVEMPVTVLNEINQGQQQVEVWVYTKVREDAFQLFGFLDYTDKQVFELLLGVNKVGPKVALAILAHMGVEDIIRAIDLDDHVQFSTVPGVGPTTAKKILVELKSKRKRFTALSLSTFSKPVQLQDNENLVWQDIESALENLGYKTKQIRPVVLSIQKSSLGSDFEVLFKEALAQLQGNKKSKTISPDMRELF